MSGTVHGRGTEFVMGSEFEGNENILHIWFPEGLTLVSSDQVTQFFAFAQREAIDPAPGTFYLLVNYTNLTIDPSVTDAYTAAIKKFQHRLRGTFRYRVKGGLTAAVVRLANLRLAKSSRIYTSETEARAAIRQDKLAEQGRV